MCYEKDLANWQTNRVILNKTEKLYLTNISFSANNFYGLTKIYKSKQINEAIRYPDNLTVRPVVGGSNCPTRPLSQFSGKILKPFLIHIKSYVSDNVDFLRRCSRKNNDSTTLVTFDVNGLYTSIPQNYGLKDIPFHVPFIIPDVPFFTHFSFT